MERLIRYTARGAVSLERLEEDANGDLIYRFTRPWPDGTTGIFIYGEGAILVDRGGKKTRVLFKSAAGWGRIHMVPPAVLKQR